MLIGTPSAKCFCGIEGEDWEELYDYYKEMSRTVGVRKPQEAQKVESPVENEGSQGSKKNRGRRDPTNHFWSDIEERSGTAGNVDEVSNVEKGFKQ